jgi:hypothetical protein
MKFEFEGDFAKYTFEIFYFSVNSGKYLSTTIFNYKSRCTTIVNSYFKNGGREIDWLLTSDIYISVVAKNYIAKIIKNQAFF